MRLKDFFLWKRKANLHDGIFLNDKNSRDYWKKDKETGSTLSFRDGFFILELYGNPYERGLAHGKLLHDEIEKSNICAYYGNFLKTLFHSSDLIKKIPNGARKPITDLLEFWYYSPLEKMCLPETRDEIYGICDAMRWDENKRKQALRATFAPDIMEQLAADHLKGIKESLGSYYRGGCSTAYAGGDALRNKNSNQSAILARNLDFPGVFVWKPAIIFSYPTEKLARLEKGKMKETKEIKPAYVSVSSAGFPGFGLHGMNSCGLTYATLVGLSENRSREGMSTLDFNHYLFTRAKSIDDIIEMAGDSEIRCMSPHMVVFADGKNAISLEVDSLNKKIRNSEFGLHAQTNHFINPVIKKKEIIFPLEKDFNEGRYWLIKEALDENYGDIDLRKMIDIISCNLNFREGKTALVGDFPAQPNTLVSFVSVMNGKAGKGFHPEKNELWVASGKAPVCYNIYYKFGFNKDFSWNRKSWGRIDRSSIPVLKGTGFSPVNSKMKDSIKYFMLAQEDYKIGKRKFALENLDKAIELYPDPGYRYIRGSLHLEEGDAENAYQEFLFLKKNHSFSPAKDSYLSILLGNSLDALGKREEALKYYKKVLHKNKSEQFQKIASYCIKHPFSPSRIKSMDFLLMGPLEL